MAAATAGAVNVVQHYEDMLKALIDYGSMTAGYRPRGTQREVVNWYIDAVNIGLTKLNEDSEAIAPGTHKFPLLNF